MFVLDQLSTSYNHPIELKIPGDDCNPITLSFKAKYRRLTQDEIEKVAKDVRVAWGVSDLTDEEKSATPKANREIIDTLLDGWEDIMGADNKPLPFNPGNVDKLLSIKGVQAGLINSWFESLNTESNIAEAEQKN